MEILVGRPISPGFAQGTAVLFGIDKTAEVPKYRIAPREVDREFERLRQAIARSCSDMEELQAQVAVELGHTHSSIFSAHLALLQDKGFVERIREKIIGDGVNAEQAVESVVRDLVAQMRLLDNPYLRDRAQDVRDIGSRVIKQLVHAGIRGSPRLESRSIIVARELLPSETVNLDREHVVAVVTEEGGENSHAAILARALGIPAVTGVVEATSRIAPGAQMLVDGQSGRITIAPTGATADDFRAQMQEFADVASTEVRDERLDSATLDGTRISLFANISRSSDAQLVSEHRLDGVGLFRTEFMFLDMREPPDVEHQTEVYREVIDSLKGQPLVIRTLDLGGDKVPHFLATIHEANPTLGVRGLRFSLAHPELFDTQLSAIIAACERCRAGNVRVLFPMVLGESDLQRGIDRVRALSTHIDPAHVPTIGAMIETPSALFSLEQILKLVDFVSVGTNDLTQLMLAADRHAVDLAGEYSVLHPSMLRALRTIVDTCAEAGREVCVCGEAAGDPAIARLLVGMGIRQLSVSPRRAAKVRVAIRHSRLEHLRSLACEAIAASSVQSVRRMLAEAFDDRDVQHEVFAPTQESAMS